MNETFEECMVRLFNGRRVNRVDLFNLLFNDQQKKIDNFKNKFHNSYKKQGEQRAKIKELELHIHNAEIGKGMVKDGIKKLQAIIDDLAKGISFYGDEKNWAKNGSKQSWNNYNVIKDDFTIKSKILLLTKSGKTARALQAKYPEIFKC